MKIDDDEALYLMEYIEKKAHDWLVDLTYWYGWKRGFTACKEDGNKPQPPGMGFFLVGWEAQPWNLEFQWYRSYGHLYLSVRERQNDSLADFMINGRQLDEIVAINRNDINKLEAQTIEALATRLEKMFNEFFPGINQLNGLRICLSPAHYYNQPKPTYSIHSKPHISICRLINRTWICKNCIESFGLEEEQGVSMPLKKYQNEMDRLTCERKLAILQRDQFTCQKCGNSVANTQDLNIRVKHIIPITQGGKTVMDKLTTVCSECEKGDEEKK